MIANSKRILFEKSANAGNNMLNPRNALYIKFEGQSFFTPKKVELVS